jgi:hypothetical protein
MSGDSFTTQLAPATICTQLKASSFKLLLTLQAYNASMNQLYTATLVSHTNKQTHFLDLEIKDECYETGTLSALKTLLGDYHW